MSEVKVNSLWKLVEFEDEQPYQYVVMVNSVGGGRVWFTCLVDEDREKCLVGRDDLSLPLERFKRLYVEVPMENV